MIWWVEEALKTDFELSPKYKKIAVLAWIFKEMTPADCVRIKDWFSRAIIEALRVDQKNQAKGGSSCDI
jgi:hypothetical protein